MIARRVSAFLFLTIWMWHNPKSFLSTIPKTQICFRLSPEPLLYFILNTRDSSISTTVPLPPNFHRSSLIALEHTSRSLWKTRATVFLLTSIFESSLSNSTVLTIEIWQHQYLMILIKLLSGFLKFPKKLLSKQLIQPWHFPFEQRQLIWGNDFSSLFLSQSTSLALHLKHWKFLSGITLRATRKLDPIAGK